MGRRTPAPGGTARPVRTRAAPHGPPACRPRGSRLEYRAGEVVRVERAQVLEPLADPDELDRHAELLCDGERDAALRRAVELREHDARYLDRLAEQHGLAQPILAGRGVDREQRLVRG